MSDGRSPGSTRLARRGRPGGHELESAGALIAAHETPATLNVGALMSLQRLAGNSAVAALLARKEGPTAQRSSHGGACACGCGGACGAWTSDEPDGRQVAQRLLDVLPVSRYTLKQFPEGEEGDKLKRQMAGAIPKAAATVKKCRPKDTCVANAINDSTYYYDFANPDCGATQKGTSDILLGRGPFVGKCCRLDSTIAHEASHVCGFDQPQAYKLECDCFKCSCSKSKDGRPDAMSDEAGDGDQPADESDSTADAAGADSGADSSGESTS